MNPNLSIMLDLARFLAALTVLIGHLSSQRISGGFLWQAEAYGQQAVMVFFVLSGFVIAYVTDARESTPQLYLVNRLSRLYSVVVPALVLTAALDAIGKILRPDLYTGIWGYNAAPMSYVEAATFSDEIWVPFSDRIDGPGSDVPFWSLGYEALYYIIYGTAVFAKASWRWWLAAAACAAAGPYVLQLFPIWLAGAASYRFGKAGVAAYRGRQVAVFAVAALIFYEACLLRSGHPPRLADCYITGTLGALLLLGLAPALPKRRIVPAWLARLVRWCAGATFSLYLAHMPIMQVIAAMLPKGPRGPGALACIFVGTPALCFLFAAFTERRKEVWRRLFTFVVNRLWPEKLRELPRSSPRIA